MDIEKLRSFLAVAQEGNFSRAARVRLLTQSAISLHVQALESELGVRLVERLPRQSVLTPEGHELREAAMALVEQHDRMRSHFEEKRRSGAGRVRVAATNSLILYYLPPRIEQFVKRHPLVGVSILPMRRDAMLQTLQRGECDFALMAAGPVPRGLAFHEIFRSELMLIAARSHPLALLGKSKVTLSDIARHPIVSYTEDSAIHRMVHRTFEKHGLSMQIALATGGAEVVKRYVEVGFGVGFVSRLALRAEDEARLHVASMRRFFPEGRRYGVVLRGAPLSPAARRLLRIVAPGLSP